MSMRRGGVGVLSFLVALCVCGSAVAAGPPIRSYLLRSGEQPGYTVVKRSVRTFHTAAGFGEYLLPIISPEQLRTAGFVEAAGEGLRGSHHRIGDSLVARFTNRRAPVELAKGFEHWMAELVNGAKGLKVRRFSLPGVARSYGISYRGRRGGVAFLFWAEGDCWFVSGQDVPHAGRLTPKQLASALIAGAESQQDRTNGTCGALAATFTG